MHIQTIRSIAKKLGISSAKVSKPELIRAIQRAEGNFDCFDTASDGYCDQYDCFWREDCLPNTATAAVEEAPAPTKRASKPKASAKPKTESKAVKAEPASKPKVSKAKKASKAS